MKITVTIARILLGLVFFAAGLSGFLLIAHPPALPPGLAGAFQDVFFRSRWVLFVDGVELGRMKRRKLPFYRRKIGLVFQDFKLLPNLTVYENVAFALRVLGEPDRLVQSRAAEALDTVGLAGKELTYPTNLSGGEQQRVAIARALVHAPRMIIADEPTGNLDPATAWEIMQLFLRINARGATVVMATHNREIVDLLRRRVVAIDAGQIARDDRSGRYHDDVSKPHIRAQ